MSIMEKKKWLYVLTLTIIIYVLSHGLMLLLYGAWWDDMLQWNVSEEMLNNLFGTDNFNNPFIYYTNFYLSKIGDLQVRTFISRLIPFVCWLISTMAFYFVIKKITSNYHITLISSLLVASCGLNKSIVMICCYHYSISIALFMLGLLFFVYDFFNDRAIYKIFSSTLWCLSLLVWRPAVLVIPVLVLIASICKNEFNWRSIKSYLLLIKETILGYWIYIVGLLLFSVLYTTVLAPKGEYSSYYGINILHILLSPFTTITSCISILIQHLHSIFLSFARPGRMFIITIILAPIVYMILLRGRKSEDNGYNKKTLLYVCLIFFFFSVMPQKLIGENISFFCNMEDQWSRQASLAIFPISVLLGLFLNTIQNGIIRRMVACVLITGSVLFSNYTILDYERGWARNEAIVCYLSENREMEGKTIMVYNNAMDYSIFYGTGDSYYEYEGCARLAYGVNTDTKFISYYKNDSYNKATKPDYYLLFGRNEEFPTPSYRLMMIRLFKPELYKEIVSKMLFFQLSEKPIIEEI